MATILGISRGGAEGGCIGGVSPSVCFKPSSPSFSFLSSRTSLLARELTLLDSQIFLQIRPFECLNQAWNNKDKKKAMDMSPHIVLLLRRFNEVSSWIASEIVSARQLQTRVNLVLKLIKLIKKLAILNNYNGVMQILTALQSPPVFRLKETWAGVEKERGLFATFKEMLALMSPLSNYFQYRSVLLNISPPAIPYLGVYLTDLTFIELTNNDSLHEKSVLNFDKRRKIASIIRDIRRFQASPYPLHHEVEVSGELQNVTKISCYQSDEQKLMQSSFECEKSLQSGGPLPK